jgi:hypothetical protein
MFKVFKVFQMFKVFKVFKVFQMFTSQKLEQWNMCIPIAIGIKCADDPSVWLHTELFICTSKICTSAHLTPIVS